MKRETGSGSGTASLVRASIRAAHYGNSRASERVLHPRRSARIVEPANNETRIELKAHSMPLYTDQTHKISIPPSSFRGPQNTKVLDRSRESQDVICRRMFKIDLRDSTLRVSICRLPKQPQQRHRSTVIIHFPLVVSKLTGNRLVHRHKDT
jgi:hypothetical protein